MTDSTKLDLVRASIREVPDFPKPGILFRDITPLLGSPRAYQAALDLFEEQFASSRLDRIVGMESRGFLFGAPLADRLGVGFAPIRKPGKLPCATESATYELEYGTDTLQIHRDAVSSGQRVLVLDDLLATGGTARAAVELVRRLGANVVACAFVIELAVLKGRSRLAQETVFSLVVYA